MLQLLSRFSWKQLQNMPKREERILVLPISSMEQHGPQLPLGTDDFILRLVLDGLLESELVTDDIFVLPSIHYGMSPEHMDFVGTFTLSAETMIRLVEDVLQCMKAHGFRYLCLMNSHGGNTSFLHAMSQTWKRRFDIEVFHVDLWGSGMFERAASILKTPVALDVHGGEIETSLLMCTGETTWSEEQIAGAEDYLVACPTNRGSWTANELSPTGAIGGVSRSTAETGEELRNFLLEDVARQLNSLRSQLAE